MSKKGQVTIIKRVTTLPSLTSKFEQAIILYARAKGERPGGMVETTAIIKAALGAYRMGYEDLYYWMAKHSYRWDSRHQMWRDKRKSDE